MKANGIHAPTVRTNSWKAIANSKIELIEYEKLSALSDIAERKENLSGRIEKGIDFVFENIEATDKEKKLILKMVTLDAIYAKKRLQARIEELIEEW